MPRGGARPNTGPKRGSKHQATITKEQAREAFRAVVQQHMGQLLEAQIANARGLQYLVSRDKRTGKFTRVTEDNFDEMSPDTLEVWAKDPSVQAFTDLMNRTLDKPAEQEQQVAVSGELVISWKK